MKTAPNGLRPPGLPAQTLPSWQVSVRLNPRRRVLWPEALSRDFRRQSGWGNPLRKLAALWESRPAFFFWKRLPPLKGLSDNPAYQWWRDPTILQPDSWWGAEQNEASLGAQMALMRELGAPLFRVDLPWRAIAPERPGGARYDAAAARDPDWPGYRWERLDLIVRLAEAAGIALVPQVVFAPEWSSGVSSIPHAGGAAAKRSSATAAPGAAEHVSDLFTALVQRYGAQIRFWEVWNEPDHPHSWGGTLAEYVERVLHPASAALRAARADCRVLLGGLADARNLEAIYAAGGAPAFDVANIHVYPTRASVGQVRRAVRQARGAMARYRETQKPLWITECGLATQPPSNPSPFGGVTNEAGQARFIRRLFRTVQAEAIFWYQLHDSIILNAEGHALKEVYWGLVSRDLQRRKAGSVAFSRAGSRVCSPLWDDSAAPAPRRPLPRQSAR